MLPLHHTKRAEIVPLSNHLNFRVMATFETKGKTLTESYKDFISSFITDEAENYLSKEKNAALAASKEFQELKAKTAKLRAEILANVTNKLYARKLAVNFAHGLWKNSKIDADTLERLIIDEDGICIKDGKKVTLSTISECASFMVYLHNNLTKNVRKQFDTRHEIYIDIIGGLEWNDDVQAVCTKVAQRRNIDVSEVLQAYEAEKAKVEKAKAEKTDEKK